MNMTPGYLSFSRFANLSLIKGLSVSAMDCCFALLVGK